jgi:hypothetical protein
MTYAMKAALGGSLLLTVGLAASANRLTPAALPVEVETPAVEFVLNEDFGMSDEIQKLLTGPEDELLAWAKKQQANGGTFDGQGRGRGGGRYFVAVLTGGQVVPANAATEVGVAICYLRPMEIRLDYALRLFGHDLKRDDRTGPDDVTAIHMHVAPAGSNGQHTLNIFGMPSEDDADARFWYNRELVTGTWDDEDADHSHTEDPGDTKFLSEYIDELRINGLYFQIHTVTVPTGEIRGQILLL